MTLREDLLLAMEERGVELPPDFTDDSSLIRSGLLDSTGLMNLVLWVEERIGSELDLTSFDLPEEWETLGKLVAFIERKEAKRLRG
jgi:acyl carrier protein